MTQHMLDFEPQLHQKPATTVEVNRGPSMAPEAKRLNGHCLKILERLRQGRTSNKELSGISLKYTGRISDLRKAGHVVKLVSRDRETGLTFYELEQP